MYFEKLELCTVDLTISDENILVHVEKYTVWRLISDNVKRKIVKVL